MNSTELPEGADFSPCSCSVYIPDEMNVTCEQVFMTDVHDGVFTRLENVFLGFLYLVIVDGDSIPANFLASAVNRINWFYIDCTSNTNPLEVSSLAFDSKMTIFNNLVIINCDLSNLNFFSGMKHVDDLKFENISNLHEVFWTIPSDFEMKTLRITKCSNFYMITKVPTLLKGLVELLVYQNEGLLDDTADLLINWVQGNSQDLLNRIYLYGNGLTKIPANLWRFNKLQHFRFDSNILDAGVLKKGSLKLSYLPFGILLRNCSISTIEPGAFDG